MKGGLVRPEGKGPDLSYLLHGIFSDPKACSAVSFPKGRILGQAVEREREAFIGSPFTWFSTGPEREKRLQKRPARQAIDLFPGLFDQLGQTVANLLLQLPVRKSKQFDPAAF